jgi:hypothetical protein
MSKASNLINDLELLLRTYSSDEIKYGLDFIAQITMSKTYKFTADNGYAVEQRIL